jgi:hypothetical protein
VDEIESINFSAPRIYKYFSKERRRFFTKPQLRFSQKEVLNDPFESTVRWKSIGISGLRKYVMEGVLNVLPGLLSDPDYWIEILPQAFASNGVELNADQLKILEQKLRSDEGKAYIANQMPSSTSFTSFLEMAGGRIFAALANDFDSIIENALSKSGVLSLTERPLNTGMWKRYAEDGAGFVVGLDAQHPFFFKERDGVPTNVLRKVIYTENRTESFWRNPYYLFLVKGVSWQYEEEWRMFRSYQECDESFGTIHLANLPPEIIKTVHFGAAYDLTELEKDVGDLKNYGSSPEFFRIRRTSEEGDLEAVPI